MENRIRKAMLIAIKKWSKQDELWTKQLGEPKIASNIKRLPTGFSFTTSNRSISKYKKKTERYHLVYIKQRGIIRSKTASGNIRNEWTLNKFLSLNK